jgi:hypothetical protein
MVSSSDWFSSEGFCRVQAEPELTRLFIYLSVLPIYAYPAVT